MPTLFRVCLWLLFAQAGFAAAQRTGDSIPDPLKALQFDSVIIFNCNYIPPTGHKTHFEYAANLPCLSGIKSRTGSKALDSAGTHELLQLLSDTGSFGGPGMGCYEPRLGFTFFLKKQEVFCVLVCMDCRRLEASSLLPAQVRGFFPLCKGNDTTGSKPHTVPVLSGLSDKGIAVLMQICEREKMAYCRDQK